MKSSLKNAALGCLIVTLLAPVAWAEVYTVILTNGTTFESRYKPVDAEWDPDMSLFLTDFGNWVAIEKVDITDITSSTEQSGFGYRLDSTTIVLGDSPNDLVSEDEDGNLVPNYEIDPEPEAVPFSIQQFVSPSSAGGPATGGIPLYYNPGVTP